MFSCNGTNFSSLGRREGSQMPGADRGGSSQLKVRTDLKRVDVKTE